MYDLIVIGGGPAGITAAVTAINRRLETLIIAERWGGQTTYSIDLEDAEDIHSMITGEELLGRFRQQLDYLDFCRLYDRVVQISPEGDRFVVVTQDGDRFDSQSLIIATGAKPDRLDVPGEQRLMGKGLSYSVVTHGSLFLGKQVAVIGTDRRAQVAALELARYAHEVFLLAPDLLPAEQPLVKTLRRTHNMTIHEGVTILEMRGERYVEGIVIEATDGSHLDLPVKGIFVKLPRRANSELVRDWLVLEEDGCVKVDIHGATSFPGVFAAGDVTHISEHVLVHIGEGAKAAVEAHGYLLGKWGEGAQFPNPEGTNA